MNFCTTSSVHEHSAVRARWLQNAGTVKGRFYWNWSLLLHEAGCLITTRTYVQGWMHCLIRNGMEQQQQLAVWPTDSGLWEWCSMFPLGQECLNLGALRDTQLPTDMCTNDQTVARKPGRAEKTRNFIRKHSSERERERERGGGGGNLKSFLNFVFGFRLPQFHDKPLRNYLSTSERFRRWADFQQNMAQNTYWKNVANQSVKVQPRLRIKAGWYVADRIRIKIEPPHAFDRRKTCYM